VSIVAIMTFSIVARSDDGLMHGVAVASKFLAAGAAVPAAEAGVGALATQAYANLAFGPQGLTLLRTGATTAGAVAALVAGDPGSAQRQVGVVGQHGDGVSYTGEQCPDWAGGHAGDGFAVQGNILVGPAVVDAMRDAWLDNPRLRFAERLVGALAAGDRAGGDRRGRQSAAVYVVGRGLGYGGTSDVAMDLRVDDHCDPVTELDRLVRLHVLHFGKPDPAELLPLTGELATEVADLLAGLGHPTAIETPGLDAAMSDWAGIANLEERVVAGHIDPLVLDQLRQAAGKPVE
jgi:uncharacterized Ntn-hydrolase superfamily protein